MQAERGALTGTLRAPLNGNTRHKLSKLQGCEFGTGEERPHGKWAQGRSVENAGPRVLDRWRGWCG